MWGAGESNYKAENSVVNQSLWNRIANTDEGTHQHCGESMKHPKKQTGEPLQSCKGKT